MRAAARIAAESDGRGRTRLTTLSGQAPLLVRRTGAQGPVATVHLVGGAAGPLGGDELSCQVDVGAGAALRVESAAASVALPGPASQESRLDVRVLVSDDGFLDWRPQPLIAARNARHRTLTRIELAAAARLCWREEVVLGRSQEAAGSVTSRIRVLRSGRPLLDHEVAVGAEYPGSSGPAMTGGRRAVGSVLIVDPAWEGIAGTDRIPCAPLDDSRSGGGLSGSASVAVLPLPGPAVLVSAVAEDGLLLGRVLDEVLGRLRPSVLPDLPELSAAAA